MSVALLKELTKLAREYKADGEPIPDSIRKRIITLRKTIRHNTLVDEKLNQLGNVKFTIIINNASRDMLDCTLHQLETDVELCQTLLKSIDRSSVTKIVMYLQVENITVPVRIRYTTYFGSKELRMIIKRHLNKAMTQLSS